MLKNVRKIKSGYQDACFSVRGFTFIELMISVLIGTFLLNVLFSIYLSSVKIYKLQHEIAMLQSNGSRASYWFKNILGKNSEKLKRLNFFSVKKTARTYSDGRPIYSLYFEDEHGLKKEVIEGVEKLDYQCDSLRKNKLVKINCNELEVEESLVGILIKLYLTTGNLRREWHVYVSVA